MASPWTLSAFSSWSLQIDFASLPLLLLETLYYLTSCWHIVLASCHCPEHSFWDPLYSLHFPSRLFYLSPLLSMPSDIKSSSTPRAFHFHPSEKDSKIKLPSIHPYLEVPPSPQAQCRPNNTVASSYTMPALPPNIGALLPSVGPRNHIPCLLPPHPHQPTDLWSHWFCTQKIYAVISSLKYPRSRPQCSPRHLD